MKFVSAIITAAFLLLAVPPAEAWQSFNSYTPPAATGWYQLAVGAGGFPRHMDVADDGTRIIATDTYGTDVLLPGGTRWYQLFTTASMPAGTFNIATNAAGVFEVAICKGNTNVAYAMAADGKIYKTTNLQSAATGVTFTQTAFSAFSGFPTNTLQNSWGRIMECDPANTSGNILVVGLPTQGMYYTTDGGGTFTHSGSVTSGTTGSGTVVGFNRASSVTGSGSTAATQGVFAATDGIGIFKSTTGVSGTFSRLNTAGEPTTITKLHIDPLGRPWVGGTNVNVHNGTSWITNVSPNNSTTLIATDPNNCSASATCHVVLMSPGGAMLTSATGGLASTDYQTGGANLGQQTTIGGDVTYLNVATPFDSTGGSLTVGDIAMDKSVSGRLHLSGGQFGYFYATPFLSNTSVAYTSIGTGIEQEDVEQMLSPVGYSDIFIAAGDLSLFRKTQATLDTNAAAFGLGYGNPFTIIPGYSVDDCASTTVVVVAENGTQWSGISTNSGASFAQYAAAPAGSGGGGFIACSTATNQVWIPKGATKAYRTTNAGGSWTASTTTFGAFSPASTFQLNPVGNIVQADKTTTGVFYAYNGGNGLYKSTDSGNNWTLQFAEPNPAQTGFSMTLRCSWKVSGDCLMGTGWHGAATMTTGEPLWRSTQGSPMTVAKVPGMCNPYSFDFGAQVTAQTYASITIVGWYQASDTTDVCDPGSFTYTFGVWQSMNNGASWTNLGLPKVKPSDAGNNVDWIPSIACDKLIQGKCYAGTFGSGSFYYLP